MLTSPAASCRFMSKVQHPAMCAEARSASQWLSKPGPKTAHMVLNPIDESVADDEARQATRSEARVGLRWRVSVKFRNKLLPDTNVRRWRPAYLKGASQGLGWAARKAERGIS